MQEIKLSVLLVTYNQEKYVEQAIHSVLMQKTNFFFELLIGEDASTDRTPKIVDQYNGVTTECLHTRVIHSKSNQGASRNFFDLLSLAQGEYLAFLEGDDYWLDVTRLEKLVNWLENNHNYVGVSHRRERRQAGGSLVGYDPTEALIGQTITIADYEKGKAYSAMGSVMRNIYKKNIALYEPVLTAARNACDLIICYTTLMQGNIYILNEILGVYRVFSGSGENSYCSLTSQVDADIDSIKMYRALWLLYGKGIQAGDKICELSFDGLLYCLKRGFKHKMIDFAKFLTKRELLSVLLQLPRLLAHRISNHYRKLAFRKRVVNAE